MIIRNAQSRLKKLSRQFKIVAVTGPRQSGKTTLVKKTFPHKPYISLENMDDREFAKADTRGFLNSFKHGAILDEAQRLPELFSYLQEIVDNKNTAGQFILTGSNNFLIQENISQSLAGRVGYQHLLPLSLNELLHHKLLNSDYKKHIYQGFYPEIIKKRINPSDWYENYLNTYIERDVRQIKNISNLSTFSKFVKLCAARVGGILNMNEIGNACGIDQKTVAAWLGILQSSYIIYLLQPHHNNLNKRIVKAPKIYFCDTGLACFLNGIYKSQDLTFNPLKGPLFENLMIIEKRKRILNYNTREELFYWRDKTGHEIDLLIEHGSKITAIEFKSGETASKDDFKNSIFYNSLQKNKIKNTIYYGGKISKSIDINSKIEPWVNFI